MDRFVVTGLGRHLDGSYDCDLAAMLTVGHPDCLTNREGHRVKLLSGVRMGELEEALRAGDNDVLLALGAVVLSRHGKRVDDEALWDAPMGSGIALEVGYDEQEDDADPPSEAPPTSGEQLTQNEQLPANGGPSSSTPSEALPENDPSPTGPQSSAMATSGLASAPGTSGI